MEVDRRGFCRVAAAGAAATLAPVSPRAASAESVTSLVAAEGKLRLVPAGETSVRGYGGHVPGPLLRLKRGQELDVRLVSQLAQPTSLCWHGVRIINAMDGVAGLTQPPVAPGGSFDYRFTPPDAGLFWYHPHVFPLSAEQIGRGLYGVLIVDEPDPPQVDQELLVVLDDWSLDANDQIVGDFLDPAQTRGAGRIGALVTVNSKPAPVAAEVAPGARIRLRVLNASSSRIALVGVDGCQATVIALDGQPSEIFRPARDTVPLGPGSRFEAMVDVPRQEGRGAGRAAIVLRGLGEPDRPLVSLAIQGKPVPPQPLVAKLPDNPRLPTRIPLERALRRDLVIASVPAPAPGRGAAAPWAWSLGGVASDGVSGKPLFSARHGEAVTLSFVNRSEFVQQMHVHGHVFRVLHDLDDGWDPYWRDSILIGPGKTKHVAFVADNPGKWAVESLVLDRQVTGLAGWFEVR